MNINIYMIVKQDFPKVNFDVVEDNKYFLIKTEKIIVKINKDPWEFFITDINNKLIFNFQVLIFHAFHRYRRLA